MKIVWRNPNPINRTSFSIVKTLSVDQPDGLLMIPLATQHYMLLQRNLIYTGITRGKRLLVLIGQKTALGIAVHNDRPQRRYSGLLASLRSDKRHSVAAPPPDSGF